MLELKEDGNVRAIELACIDYCDAYGLGVMIGQAVAAIEPDILTADKDFLDKLQEGIIYGLPCHITGICRDQKE
jgi:hypothetical protein